MKILVNFNQKIQEFELEPSALIEDLKALIEVEVFTF